MLNTRYRFLNENLSRAKKRENAQEVSIDPWYLLEIGDCQNWKCALTGWDLEFQRGGTNWGGKWCNPMSCTIDRLDNNYGYIPGNVQLVTWKANMIKNHLSNDEFVNLCKAVAKNGT
jgi:hypothetical protein